MKRALGAVFLLAACTPQLDVRGSRVTATRVLAVRGEPAEARAGRAIALTALVASPQGDGVRATLDWQFCLAPRPLTESTTVASLCMDDDAGTALAPVGMADGDGVQGSLPSDVCMRVGPQVPPAGADGTRMRPPDADLTGGWQVPIRIRLAAGSDAETLFTRYRIRCTPPDVPGSTAVAFATQYRDNVNPALASLEGVARDGSTEALTVRRAGSRAVDPAAQSAPADVLRAGRVATLVARWDPSSAERYVLVDPVSRNLAMRTEALEVSWYTNAGYFDRDRTTAQAEGAAYSLNVLHLDDGVTEATVWVVLRDERGGVDFAVLRVAPGA